LFRSKTSQKNQEKANPSLADKEKSRNIGNQEYQSEIRDSSRTTKSPKLLPKANSQSGFPKLRYRNLLAHSKAHNYSRKLITKLLPKILPEICSPKLVPEAAPEQLSTIPKLVTNAVPKNAPESSSPKLSKIATENCSPKFLVNACPKVAVLQSK